MDWDSLPGDTWDSLPGDTAMELADAESDVDALTADLDSGKADRTTLVDRISSAIQHLEEARAILSRQQP